MIRLHNMTVDSVIKREKKRFEYDQYYHYHYYHHHHYHHQDRHSTDHYHYCYCYCVLNKAIMSGTNPSAIRKTSLEGSGGMRLSPPAAGGLTAGFPH